MFFLGRRDLQPTRARLRIWMLKWREKSKYGAKTKWRSFSPKMKMARKQYGGHFPPKMATSLIIGIM